ncbi:hypothetical protein BaRGS_00034283 [Batillaria attramentaria]|uniref:SGNH hydrolase-type esterase domain-containing protein n=1 Tax=Batillaria attramentaria TaxID=370345 RepID=A0ABD0JHN4_9CAEN
MQGDEVATYDGETVQVISVSGLQTTDLVDWLQQQPLSPHVTLVTFHVGVNDCKGREVTSPAWEKVIQCCKRAFPSARIQASSIVPAMGNQAWCHLH